MSILYAEDDPDDITLFRDVIRLINPSIACIMAQNGQEALTILNQSKELPDFIFLDINMPIMDGIRCLLSIRCEMRYADIPVIMYSNNIGQKQTFLNLGASQCLTKHNSFNQALLELASILYYLRKN